MIETPKTLTIVFEGKDVEDLREIVADYYGRKKSEINLDEMTNENIIQVIMDNIL